MGRLAPGLQNRPGTSETSGAKIDQYLKQDLEWRGSKPDYELQKLYEVGVKHPTHIYYAFSLPHSSRSCGYHKGWENLCQILRGLRGLRGLRSLQGLRSEVKARP